ncbi:SGNH/GDSL hydrolase family protein [Parafrankia sp. FMc2]|uniref:SGNH/GDSL hydrolase family protein n=1 Tax=Parafrankia sp. FMc2 TaxID=3233196 RepID=UPI0034D392C8
MSEDRRAGLVPGGRYVAMGSSFAAGSGIGPDISDGCLRSARSYPRLLAARLGLALTDVTCGGATVANLLATPQNGHPPQLEAVTADTGLVTITVGGNDLGYAAAALLCSDAAATGRPWTGLPRPAETAAAAAALRRGLVQLITTIATTAPAARVYLVTYPRLFPDPPVTCTGNNISGPDSERIAAIGFALDTAFQHAAADTGTPLVDVYAASAGHDICAAPGSRWVEGSDATGIGYHPNAAGMAAIAALVADALIRSATTPERASRTARDGHTR